MPKTEIVTHPEIERGDPWDELVKKFEIIISKLEPGDGDRLKLSGLIQAIKAGPLESNTNHADVLKRSPELKNSTETRLFELVELIVNQYSGFFENEPILLPARVRKSRG